MDFYSSIKETNRSLKEINRLVSKGTSNIYLEVTIEKKWRTQNSDFLSLKRSSKLSNFSLKLKNFFNICVLSQCKVYWINFQNIYTFTYQKTLLHALLLLVFKIFKSLQCIVNGGKEIWCNGKSIHQNGLKKHMKITIRQSWGRKRQELKENLLILLTTI